MTARLIDASADRAPSRLSLGLRVVSPSRPRGANRRSNGDTQKASRGVPSISWWSEQVPIDAISLKGVIFNAAVQSIVAGSGAGRVKATGHRIARTSRSCSLNVSEERTMIIRVKWHPLSARKSSQQYKSVREDESRMALICASRRQHPYR